MENKDTLQRMFGINKDELLKLSDIQEIIALFTSVFNDLRKEFDKTINDFIDGEDFKNYFDTLSNNISLVKNETQYSLDSLEIKFKDLLNSSDKKNLDNIKSVSDSLLKEIRNIRDNIPAEIDLSNIDSKIIQIETKLLGIKNLNAEEIRNQLESLSGDNRLDKSAIKGLDELESKIAQGGLTKFIGSSGGMLFYVDGTKKGTIKNINLKAGSGMTLAHSIVNGQDTITFTSSGSGSSIETPTGTVNGSNVTFTVSNTPVSVVSDGITYYNNNGYTLSGLTITMTSPPNNYIRSYY